MRKSRLMWSVAVTLALVGLGSVLLEPRLRQFQQERRVEALLHQMTLEEKLSLLSGAPEASTQAIPRLGLPSFRLSDGPFGVSRGGPATVMAGGMTLAATWNPDLACRVGQELGRDARAKGIHFLLGPGVNLCLSPLNGRNFEYFGEDPYLTSRMAVGFIQGVQSQGVAATIKHFLANNAEFDRLHLNTTIDERSLRELFMPAFEAAVKEAHVGGVMAAMNRVNGAWMTQNRPLNVDVLKDEWGFDGILMSDWWATHETLGATRGGLDLEMPDPKYFAPDKLKFALSHGLIHEREIDDKVRRLLRTALRFGWLDREQSDLSLSRYNEQGIQRALETAREGITLLKNDRNLLPLDKHRCKTLAVLGPNAATALPTGGGSAQVQAFGASSIVQSLRDHLGPGTQVHFSRGLPTLEEMAQATPITVAPGNKTRGFQVEYFTDSELSQPAGTRLQARQDEPRLPGTKSQRWTGWFTPAKADTFECFVKTSEYDRGHHRLRVDGRLIMDSWLYDKTLVDVIRIPLDARPHQIVVEHCERGGGLESNLRVGIRAAGAELDEATQEMIRKADAAVLAVGFSPESESEGADRTFCLPPGQEALIQAVAALNPNTLVVMTSGGGVDMRTWLPKVPVLIQSWYPGQEGGTALAEILFGDVNPSGRLPLGFDSAWEENPMALSYYPGSDPHEALHKAGLFVGYRGYDQAGKHPLFPFGFGLSYTTFHYANLKLKPKGGGCEVSFDLTNTGSRAGADVAQVYVGSAHSGVVRPEKELKGFAKVWLNPGETRRVSLTLDARAFSYFDAQQRAWRIEPGKHAILVGRSSQELMLQGSLKLDE